MTWDPTHRADALAYSNGNRTATFAGGSYPSIKSVNGYMGGRWYWEVSGSAGFVEYGPGCAASNGFYPIVAYENSGLLWHYQNGGLRHLPTWTSADRMACAADFDAKRFWFSKNGEWLNGDPASGVDGISYSETGEMFSTACINGANTSITSHHLNTEQIYAAPLGFQPYAVAPPACMPLRVQQAGQHVTGTLWFRHSGAWQQAVQAYSKTNGTWQPICSGGAIK